MGEQCKTGTYYNRPMQGCVDCPSVIEQGCNAILDEETKQNCLESCNSCKSKQTIIVEKGYWIKYIHKLYKYLLNLNI